MNFGIVGAGAIAEVFATSLVRSGTGRVARVLGREPERVQGFADRHAAEVALSFDDLVPCDAVYVATPHAHHAEAVRTALELGLPVLCEKPMTTSALETERLVERATRARLPLIEAWMYRFHPQITRLVELVRGGSLGRPRKLASWFGFHARYDPAQRLFSPELGGGAILDVGGYPVSLALLVASVLGDASQPELVRAEARLAPTGVDERARARLVFAEGLVADVRCAIVEESGRGMTLECERGTISLPDPFMPGGRREGLAGSVTVHVKGVETTEAVAAEHDCYALEALAFKDVVERGALEPPAPAVDHAQSVRIARVLDAWREEAARSA